MSKYILGLLFTYGLVCVADTQQPIDVAWLPVTDAERNLKAPTAWREYNTKAGRIRDFRAWLLLPSGKDTEKLPIL